jgi:hypothetical protein
MDWAEARLSARFQSARATAAAAVEADTKDRRRGGVAGQDDRRRPRAQQRPNMYGFRNLSGRSEVTSRGWRVVRVTARTTRTSGAG